METHLSCDDLKFRWKLEPIRKQEEKLKVIIKGEEAALQKLLNQKASSESQTSTSNAGTGTVTVSYRWIFLYSDRDYFEENAIIFTRPFPLYQ